ncbi:MAG: hypothetical protein ACFB00_11895 [Parvularculaceae bacterium]
MIFRCSNAARSATVRAALGLASIGLFSIGLFSIGLASIGAAAADSGAHSQAHAQAHTRQAITPKTGAAVSFSHAVRGPTAPGEIGSVVFEVAEAYEDGAMTLEANADDGLELIGLSSSGALGLGERATHTWEAFFRAQNAGVYYVNVFARVARDGRAPQSRTYSARIVVGDAPTEKTSRKAIVLDADTGAPMVMMKAAETISER